MAKEIQSQKSDSNEMSIEDARAYRAARYKPSKPVLTEEEKREEFRIFWAANKSKYDESKGIEKALWLHLKAIKMDSPEQFSAGCQNFGLVKVK
jgi:hypothetical protein